MFTVIKIGGSLFSQKDVCEAVDEKSIDRFARMVATLHRSEPGRLAIVIGGGSFGHFAVRTGRHQGEHELTAALTEANFRLKTLWCSNLRKLGVPALPLQLTGFARLANDGIRSLVCDGLVLRRLIASRFLPILSGDLVVGDNSSLHVVGSDRIPELFVDAINEPIRHISLTDTHGVLEGRNAEAATIREISRGVTLTDICWESDESDVTGSMVGKLTALYSLADLGVECVVLHGESALANPSIAFEPLCKWPREIRFTTIAAPRGASSL